mgnify:FL=1
MSSPNLHKSITLCPCSPYDRGHYALVYHPGCARHPQVFDDEGAGRLFADFAFNNLTANFVSSFCAHYKSLGRGDK